MQEIEIARRGDQPVGIQLAEMRVWLDDQGMRASKVNAVRIFGSRVTYRASFHTEADADRFRAAFVDAEST